MIYRIQVMVGLAAAMLNIVAIVCFLGWFAQTDILFGHKKAPPSYILTALWLALIGVIATVVWFLIGLYGKLRARMPTTLKPVHSGLMWFQGIALAVLLLPACLTVLIGIAEYPEARISLQVERIKAGAVTPAELIDRLKSAEGRVRWAAASELGSMGDRSAVEPLVRCLEDEDVMLRIGAAQALAKIGDTRAMRPLMEALEDESYMVRVWAASGLATIGDPSCIPALEELALKDQKNRSRLERAIEEIRNREASEELR